MGAACCSPWRAGIALALVALMATPLIGGSSGGDGATLGLGLLLAALIGAVLGLIARAFWRDDPPALPDQPRSPQAILDQRLATSELTPQQYHEALLDLLKGRFVRGEMELAEYELRVKHLLSNPRSRLTATRE
jgi:hypothetical protein